MRNSRKGWRPKNLTTSRNNSRRSRSRKRVSGERFSGAPRLAQGHIYMIANTQNIRDLRQWLCWRTEEREGKPIKVPYNPLTGERASSTDLKTWASYSETVSAHREYCYHGIGFVFTP